jgi:hypothetical protein
MVEKTQGFPTKTPCSVTLHVTYTASLTAPSSPPGNVRARNLSSTSIMVSWDEVPAIDQNGMIVNYEVLYQPLVTFDGAIGPDNVSVEEMSVVLVALEGNVEYNISVRAYTSEGAGPYSIGVIATTNEDGRLKLHTLCHFYSLSSFYQLL